MSTQANENTRAVERTMTRIAQIARNSDPNFESLTLKHYESGHWYVSETTREGISSPVRPESADGLFYFTARVIDFGRGTKINEARYVFTRDDLPITNTVRAYRSRRIIVQHYHFDDPQIVARDGAYTFTVKHLELRVPASGGTVYVVATDEDANATPPSFPRDLFDAEVVSWIDSEVESIIEESRNNNDY